MTSGRPGTDWPAGYFTSRATSKGWIREATSYLQAARQLEVLTGAAAPTDRTTAQLQGRANTDSLEEAVSLLQHHDAITGTEKQHVANDYHARLARGAVLCACSLWNKATGTHAWKLRSQSLSVAGCLPNSSTRVCLDHTHTHTGDPCCMQY